MPGLDSLRGAAVAAVVAYHLGWISGGFLGVDLFFVLSGYLITSLMLGEVSRRGSLDLLTFWRHRARRLAPAVFVLVPVVLVAAVAVGWPLTTRRGLALDGVAALTWWSNWRYMAGGGYWDAGPRPFLHTWSLAVEEQFYLVWPLVVVAVAAAVRRWHVRVRPVLGIVAAVAGTASFAWAAVQASRLAPADFERIYLGTTTRIGTPLVGCVLACVLAGRLGPDARPRLASWLRVPVAVAAVFSAAALVGLAVTVSVDDPDLYRQGYLPLVAVLGAVLVLGASQVQRTDLVSRYLGLRSYAIYLWSYPLQVLLVFARPEVSRVALTLVVVPATLVISEVSYRLVERPVHRRVGWARRSPGLVAGAAAGSVVVVASLALLVATAIAPPAYTQATDDELVAGALAAPADPVGREGLRIMTAGDSVPYTLAEVLEPDDLGDGIGSIDNRALPRCSILYWGAPDILQLSTVELAADLSDPETYDELYRAQRSQPVCQSQLGGEQLGLEAEPDVVLLAPGAMEWGLAQVDGERAPAFGPGMATQIERSLMLRARNADEAGARTVIVEWFCPGPAWPGPKSNADYTTWLNGVIARTAEAGRAEGLDIAVASPDATICVDGDPAGEPTPETEAARPDGIHVKDAEGAAHIWAWLGPAILASGD